MGRHPVPNPTVHRPADKDLQYPHHVYRLFDKNNELLYIGVTADVESRVYMHLQTYVMADWPEIHARYSHHDSIEYPTRLEARAAERRDIAEQAPLLNRQHNPKRWVRLGRRYVPVDPESHTAT